MNSSAALPHIHELVSGIAAPSRHCRLAALPHACALQTAALPRALRSSDYYCSSWLRCVSSLGRAVAVCMARAREIKMKFAAFTLHLEGIDTIERAAKSSEHADSMVAVIGSAALKSTDTENVLHSIVLAERFVQSGSGNRGTLSNAASRVASLLGQLALLYAAFRVG